MTTQNRRGTRLRRFAERTFEASTLERVIFPAIADLEYECGANGGASVLVRLRAYWGLWKALAVCLLTHWSKQNRPAVESVARRMTVIFPIVMGLVMVPALNSAFGKQAVWTHVLAYLPQATIAAFPIAFFFAVAFEQSSKSLRRLVPAVFGMSLVCTLVMLTVTLFVVPMANRAYSASISEQQKLAGRPSAVSFGPAEWTFTELVRRARYEALERDRTAARHALGMRFAASTLPIALGFVALGIAGYERVHSLFLGVWMLMFYVAALRAAGSSSLGPSVVGVWLVHAGFVLAGLCLVWLRPNPLSDGAPKGYVIS